MYSPTDFTDRHRLFGCLQGGALVSARLCRLPEQEVHQPRSAPTEQNRYSPTESTEPTELLAECILPQISQICTEVRLPSRGCTCLKCTNQARSAPTEQEVHQPSKIDILPRNPQNPQNCLLRVFSHRLHRFTQKLGCLQGGALVSARLCHLPEQEVHQPSYIGAPLAMLVHLRQVHPLKLAASVNSACSVGGILLRRRQGYLRYYLRTLTIYVNLLSMLKSKCFDHYFHFKLRFYILG